MGGITTKQTLTEVLQLSVVHRELGEQSRIIKVTCFWLFSPSGLQIQSKVKLQQLRVVKRFKNRFSDSIQVEADSTNAERWLRGALFSS